MADNDNNEQIQPTQPTNPADTVDKPQSNYKSKWRDTLITDAGREMFKEVGSGAGKLSYTRVVLSAQQMNTKDGKSFDDDVIRRITTLTNVVKEGNIKLSPVEDSNITVTASFNNKDQDEDITFSTIGWFARIDRYSGGTTVHGQEVLYAITPATNATEILPAGSPDHRSTQAITVELSMPISNTANVSLTVNEAGIVYQSDLDIWAKKIQNYITNAIKNISISIGNSGPFTADDSGKIVLPVYTAQDVDDKIRKYLSGGAGSGTGTGGTTNPDQPIDTDNMTKEGFESVRTGLATRIKYLADNAVLGQRFTDVKSAQEYEDTYPDRIGILKDTKVAVPQITTQEDTVKLDDTDKDGHYKSGEVSAIIDKFNNKIRGLEKIIVIGKHFTDKSEAKDWAAQHQEYLAYIETSEEQHAANNDKRTSQSTEVPVAALPTSLAETPAKPAANGDTTQPSQATQASQTTQATDPINAEGDVMYYTKGEFNAKFKELNESIKFLEQNALMSKHFDSEVDVEAWESKQANYLGFTD